MPTTGQHIGVNITRLAYYSPIIQAQNLDHWAGLGVKVIRTFAANQDLSHQEAAGYLGRLADAAQSRGIQILPVLTDLFGVGRMGAVAQPRGDWVYNQQSPSGFNILGHRWYVDGFREHYLPWIQEVVGRLHSHPAIYAWELGNELKDEEVPGILIPMMTEAAQFIWSLTPQPVASGISSVGGALLTPDQGKQLYIQTHCIVTEHRYNGEEITDLGLAWELGLPYLVEETGFSADCGQGGRATSVKLEMTGLFGAGITGYYPWGAQSQAMDINDGDNNFGLDRYCHRDFEDICRVLGDQVDQFPPSPGPSPVPPPDVPILTYPFEGDFINLAQKLGASVVGGALHPLRYNAQHLPDGTYGPGGDVAYQYTTTGKMESVKLDWGGDPGDSHWVSQFFPGRRA